MNIAIDLAEKIKKGDEKAFEEVFRNLYTPLCAYANKYLRDVDQAEETEWTVKKYRSSLSLIYKMQVTIQPKLTITMIQTKMR